MIPAQRGKHDLAYACFLVPLALSAVIAIGTFAPIDDATAAGLGLAVAVPLALAALIAVPVGIGFSVVLWRDGILPCLSVLTVLWIVEVITQAGSVAFYNATTGPIYASFVLVLEASWFLWRRMRGQRAAQRER